MRMISRRQRKHAHRGAVAVEAAFVLFPVILLILGIMSALGYGTYRQARISAQRTEESQARTREIEFGIRVMAQDFAQVAPRPAGEAATLPTGWQTA